LKNSTYNLYSSFLKWLFAFHLSVGNDTGHIMAAIGNPFSHKYEAIDERMSVTTSYRIGCSYAS